MRAGSYAGTRWNRHCRFDVGNRTATIAAQRHYRIWNTPARLVSDGISHLERTGRTLPRLAKYADPFTQERLLALAAEYDARIAKLEPQPSAATRILRGDDS
jgi:hypothetical protein